MIAAVSATVPPGPLPPGRLYERALRSLRRPGAWIDATPGGFGIRLSPDRRRRPTLQLDAVTFAALKRDPGLHRRPDGGWRLEGGEEEGPPPGRPGHVEGEIVVVEPGGRPVRRRGNLGESALMWLARRKGADGRPLISPLELMAGERFRRDREACGDIGRLTMDWSGVPHGGGGPRLEPAERARAAKARVQAALRAVGPDHAPILERICVAGSALQLVERELGLRPRTGKVLLRTALGRLVRHYRLG